MNDDKKHHFSESQKPIYYVTGLVSLLFLSLIVSNQLTLGIAHLNYYLVTIIFLYIFTIVYFFAPSVVAKAKLSFLFELIYLPVLAIAVYGTSQNTSSLFLFLVVLMAINAFTKNVYLYLLSILEIIAISLMYLLTNNNFSTTDSIINIFSVFLGIIGLSIVFRILALEKIILKKKHDELTIENKHLVAQKEQIDRLIENISDGLISINKDYKIDIANREAVKILLDDEDHKNIISQRAEDVLNIVSDEGKVSILDEVMSKGKTVFRNDLKLVKDDEILRVSTSTSPVYDKDGKILGAIMLIRDITGEKDLEDQRAEFNAIASHELRTPLTIINGYISNILTDKDLKYDKQTEAYLYKIMAASESIIRLTNDILTVTKAENNQIKLNLVKVDVKKIAKAVISEQKPKADAKGLELILEMPKELPMIYTDPEKIKEVMVNLIDNSIKFTNKGYIKLAFSITKAKELFVSVEDTGVGISKNSQERIFEKFYRTEDWKTRKTGGTGLGLYISKYYIEKLGGNIGLKSAVGKGTTLWFDLPITLKSTNHKKQTEKQLEDFIKTV